MDTASGEMNDDGAKIRSPNRISGPSKAAKSLTQYIVGPRRCVYPRG